MQLTLIRLLFAFLCSLPFSASAATQTIHVDWSYTPPSEPAVIGFKLYQEGAFACETHDPTVTAMDCSVTLATATTNFTLTATFNDGTESPQSAPFAFTLTDTTAPLQAVISAAPLTGTAPFTVNFNATSSTGSISLFQWDFGDGSTVTGSTASHEYKTAGTYLAKLTVTDSTGQASTTTVSVTAAAPVVQLLPPTAVISSSTAAGPAPLAVNFDGSRSTAANNATITTYSWNFGDGSSTTGVTASHSFTAAGTCNTTLTVLDSNGLTNSISTPVMVDAAISVNNAPTAVINATQVSSTIPMTVTFDGSASTDSDGSIATYSWNFGDGGSGIGKTVTHTYTTAATFTATLQVTDDKGATDSAITTITAQPEEQQTPNLNIETGEVPVTGEWGRVTFATPFQNPVVIAGPAGINDTDPGVIRLRNIDATGFEIKMAEWDYLDDTHPEETVSYIVMEKGRTTLPDGSIVEAGTFNGAPTNQNIRYSAPFNKIPVVITTVASENELDTISGRLSKITTSSFAYYFKEQEKNKNVHVKETVNFIAWEPGMGIIGTLRFEVAKTAAGLTDAWSLIPFQQTFQQPPLFLADMQTNNNTDTSTLRARGAAATGALVKVEEEQSKDLETTHPEETVGFILLDQEEYLQMGN